MAQNTPNAPTGSRRTSSGYAAAFDGKLAQFSGVEYGGDAIVQPGDGTNGSSDDDTVYALLNTSTSGATFTLSSSDVAAGRTIHVIDVGGNAATNNITVDTEGGENIDGAVSATIGANYGSVTVMSDGTNWFSV